MTPRPIILIVVKGLGLGGAEKLLSESARVWDRASFDYRIAYLLPTADALVTEIRGLDVDVHCPAVGSGIGPGTGIRLRRLIQRLGADLVHAHLPMAGVIARLTAPCPVVYTEHNVVNSYHPLTRLANRFTYRRNQAVIAVSQAVAASVNGYPGPSPIVIPNGVSISVAPDEVVKARAELGLSDGRRLVVHVGNIRPGKGHEDLLEAVAHLADRHPDILFVSIGAEKTQGDLERLRELTRARGLQGRLLFLGPRQDALSFTAAADLYVNPSQVEGLPVAVLEAMALRRPVVATKAGGVPEIVQDRLTGLLVEPGDAKSLAEAIDEMLKNPALAGRLAEAGRQLVHESFGLERMVKSIEDVYRLVLGYQEP